MSECSHHARVVELLDALLVEVRGVRAALESERAASSSPLYTCSQLASALQVDERTLRRLELLGDIPHAIKIGTAKRWRRADIDKYLAERKAA